MKAYSVKIYCAVLLCICATGAAAQPLSLNQAIDAALANNFNTLVAETNLKIANNSYFPGNAGYYPSLDLLALQNNSIVNTKQELLSGANINRNGARNNSINVSANLQWIVFNGFGRQVLYEQLREEARLSLYTYKVVTEQVIISTVNTYYDVVRQEQLLRNADTAMDLAAERVRLAKLKSETGSGSLADYYQAQVDHNMRKTAYVVQKVTLENAKAAFNQSLGRNATEPVELSAVYEINNNLSLDNVINGLQTNNTLQISRTNLGISQLNIRGYKSQLMPTLGVQTSYSFVKSTSNANFVLSSRNLGFNYGFTASWTLFNGFIVNRQIQNAKLGLKVADLQLKQTELNLNVQAVQAYNIYRSAIETLELEKENVKLVEFSLNIATEKYRQGNISLLQVKDAENSYVDAQTRLANAYFYAKNAEVVLMQLTGQLVK